MFIRLADARKIFKQAYKGVGLRIGRDYDGGIYLTGRKWFMYIFMDNLPKEILGEIVSLTGMIPKEGEQWLCEKGGNQSEVYMMLGREDVYRKALEAQKNGSRLTMSDMILLDEHEFAYRIYSAAGKPYLVPLGCAAMCSAGNCENEEDMWGCFVAGDNWIYWLSNHMAFAISPYEDEELTNRLKLISEAGII